MPALLAVLIVLLFAGALAFLIGRATFIDEPYKQFAKGALLFVVLIWLIICLYDAFTGKALPVPHGFL